MDPTRSVEYLDYLSEQLEQFIEMFDAFMKLHHENTGLDSIARGMAPAAFPKDDASQTQISDLKNELDRLAGTLMDLANVTSVKMAVQGFGVVDPFANWSTILQPKPMMEPSNIRGCAVQAAGRLEGMRAKADAFASPNIDPTLLHPLVWAAAQRQWNDGYRRQAVSAAAEAVTGQMKQLTARNDTADTSLWQQAFSETDPLEGKPRLRWPGDPKDLAVKNMNDGLRQFAPGTNMLLRNTAVHGSEEIEEQVALERLAVWSVLARFMDECKVLVAGEAASEDGLN